MPIKTRVYKWLFVAIFIVVWAYVLFFPVVYDNKGVVFYLQPGITKPTVISELSQQNLIHLSPLFSMYAFLRGAPLKSAEYLFPKYSTPYSIWKQMTNGTGIYYRHFTIIPGQTFAQIQATIAKTEGLRVMTTGWNTTQIMAALGHPELQPEGEFFPETYYFTRNDPDLVVLKRAFTLMQARIDEAWASRSAGLPYKDKYQALIAASLIEKEAYLDVERPIISGVIINRIKRNMLLQIDPTVIYGLGEQYDGKIYKKDLRANTPYNTYVRKGLPPTPIAMPGMESLMAATHPAQHEYLYFVSRGDGSHQFSKTLQQHNTAVDAVRKNPA